MLAAMNRVADRRRPCPRVPRVSVVLPTRDRAGLLPRAVGSVLAQTWTDLELLIVDDHSVDATPARIAAFADPRVRALRHDRPGGQSRALNTGIRAARGAYLAFIDDDDEWLPVKLAAQVAVLDAAAPDVALVYGWRRVVDDATGRVLPASRKTLRGDVFEQALAYDMPLPPSSWLLRAEALHDVGGFDETLRVAKDVDFVARLAARGWHVDFVPAVVLVKHRHPGAQLTDRSAANLAARADQVRAHMARFATELRVRPAARARLHLWLARYELPHHGALAALAALAAAFRAAPGAAARALVEHRAQAWAWFAATCATAWRRP